MVPTAKEKKSKEKTNFIVETPGQTNIIVQLFFSCRLDNLLRQ
jgi:hypothetical protein